MNDLETKCAELLTGALGVPSANVPKHPFYRHIQSLERKSKSARYIYPLVYLVLGAILMLALYQYDPHATDKWQKLFGAVLGVFAALLAFWKPAILLTQDDCMKYLHGKRLTGSDLQEINALLGLPSKKTDDVLKLVGALSSFVAIYLTVN